MDEAKSPRGLAAGSLALARMAAHWRYVIAGVLTSAAIVVFAQIAPLTFDEARDRVAYGGRTIPQIIYDPLWIAGNHIPVTVLVHLIPQRLLTWDPWMIRIFGVASGILIVVALLFVSAKRNLTPLVTVFAIVGSPLLGSYLFIVRGYTFSAVFLVGAAAVSVRGGSERRLERVCLGGLLLAIGTWPLPINALFAPGWVAAVLALWGYRVATAGAAVYATCVALMYAPILSNIQQQSAYLAGEAHWWTWLYDTFAATNVVPVCFGLVVIAAVASVARERRNIRANGPRANFAILTTVMSGGWFLLIGPMHALGMNLPFIRNGVPALWIGLFAIVAALPKKLEYFAVALLLPGLIWGSTIWWQAASDGNWKQIADKSRGQGLFYATTPATIRDLSSVRATRAVCSSWDSYVCRLVAPSLARSGIAVVTSSETYRPGLRCALGAHRPPPPFQVLVYRRATLLGVLCS